MKRSVATRSIRRSAMFSAPSVPKARPAAVQVFLFRSEAFLGTELFDVAGPVTIGRSVHSALRLEGDSLSRHHCRLIYINGQVWIEDLGSSNGTYVNRRRVERRMPVESTDAIHIGRYTLKVRALHAIPAKPSEIGATESVTRQEALLIVESSGSERFEPVIDLCSGVDQRLYEAAIRRSTSSARPVDPAEDNQSAASEISFAETSSASESAGLTPSVEDLSEARLMPLRMVPPKAGSEGVRIDPDVEARLRDLDELIAALDAKQKGSRDKDRQPLRAIDGWLGKIQIQEPIDPAHDTADGPSAGQGSEARTDERSKTEDEIVERTTLPGARKMSTVEFARDLASRLAVEGQVLAPGASAPQSPASLAPAAEAPRAPASPPPLPGAPPPLPPAAAPAVAKPPPLPRQGPAAKAPAPELPRDDTPTEQDPDDPVQEWREEYIHAGTDAVRAQPAARPPRQAERSHGVSIGAAVNDNSEPFVDDVWTGASRVEPIGGRASAFAQSKAAPPMKPAQTARAMPPPPSPAAQAKPTVPAMKPKVGRPAPKTTVDSPKGAIPRQSADEASLATQREKKLTGYFDAIEIATRSRGKLIDVAHLFREGEQYILGHKTPRGSVAPASAHIGLRMLRINPDRTVDLVFPKDVAGHLVRGRDTVMFTELTEGRKYSCLRLEAQDVGTVILGEGGRAISYHISFIRKGGR